MYKTIKLRIRADRERKQVLLAYEDIYHSALRKYVYQMILEGKPIRYDVKRIHKAIPKESKWQLYQTARNRYAYFLKHHDWNFISPVYGISATLPFRKIRLSYLLVKVLL